MVMSHDKIECWIWNSIAPSQLLIGIIFVLQPVGGGSTFEFGECMSGDEALALSKGYLKCTFHLYLL